MRLSLTLLKEKVQTAAELITITLEVIKCPKDQRCTNKFIEYSSTWGKIQPQIRTFPDRRTARSENAKNYILINSPKSSVRRADYLGQAILRTQPKVAMESYW
jgi:hypothetical protein